MNARAKLHQKWHNQLKMEWQTKGINCCELCGSTFGQALAHSKKRGHIQTKEEYWEVALLCQQCHHDAEYGNKNEPGTHERMYRIITEVIARREEQYGQ